MKSDSSFFNNRIKHEETQPVTELITRLPVIQFPPLAIGSAYVTLGIAS